MAVKLTVDQIKALGSPELQKIYALCQKADSLMNRVKKGLVVFNATDLLSQELMKEVRRRVQEGSKARIIELKPNRFLIVSTDKMNDNFIDGASFMEDSGV